VERFNLRQLSEKEVRKQFQIEILKRFAAMENSNDSEDIKQGLGKLKENIKISAKETLGLYGRKQHKPWLDEKCSQLIAVTTGYKLE
jgi:hypothetical protein